ALTSVRRGPESSDSHRAFTQSSSWSTKLNPLAECRRRHPGDRRGRGGTMLGRTRDISLLARPPQSHDETAIRTDGKDLMGKVPSVCVRLVLTSLVGAVVGCGGGNGGTAGLKPAATIVVDGSSTVVRISEAAQRAFQAVNPDVTVTVDEHGTGGGF